MTEAIDPFEPRRRLSQIAEHHLDEHATGMSAAIDMFADELTRYGEVILGPAGQLVGFMTRGEGESFTQRASMVLRGMEVSPAAIAHHAYLAEWMEHTRAFFKVEWQAAGPAAPPGSPAVPLAACYFRRRPEVETVLARLHARGLSTARQDELRQIAASLEKDTVHFVAAAFRPGHSLHHKLYFSQYVTDQTRTLVEERIDRLFDRLGGRGDLRALWRRVHRKMFANLDETTCFVSVNFTDDQRLPWFKVDYPEVSPELAAEWAPPEQREAVKHDAEIACAAAKTTRLSFLGVRLGATGSHPQLKYYADFPAPAGG
jgi:hypothetical protein